MSNITPDEMVKFLDEMYDFVDGKSNTVRIGQPKKHIKAVKDFIKKHSDPDIVIVPREPTERMVRAGIDFVMKDSPIGFAQTRCAGAYKAMLEAAKEE